MCVGQSWEFVIVVLLPLIEFCIIEQPEVACRDIVHSVERFASASSQTVYQERS